MYKISEDGFLPTPIREADWISSCQGKPLLPGLGKVPRQYFSENHIGETAKAVAGFYLFDFQHFLELMIGSEDNDWHSRVWEPPGKSPDLLCWLPRPSETICCKSDGKNETAAHPKAPFCHSFPTNSTWSTRQH